MYFPIHSNFIDAASLIGYFKFVLFFIFSSLVGIALNKTILFYFPLSFSSSSSCATKIILIPSRREIFSYIRLVFIRRKYKRQLKFSMVSHNKIA